MFKWQGFLAKRNKKVTNLTGDNCEMKKKKDKDYIDFGQWLYETRKQHNLTYDL